MKKLLKKHILIIILSVSGALGGFMYWKLIGCKTGTCPIKSVWYLSTLWGLVMGGLVGSLAGDLISKFKKAPGREDTTHND